MSSPFQNSSSQQKKERQQPRSSPFQNMPPQDNSNEEIKKSGPPPKSQIKEPNYGSPQMSSFQQFQAYNNAPQQSEFDSIMEHYNNSKKKFNCDPNFICPTTEVFPANINTLKTSHFPIGLSLSPLSTAIPSSEIPLLKYGKNDIPRCPNNNCRAYLNPFVKFIQGGEKWICNFCGNINDTEDHYYCEVDNEIINFNKLTSLIKKYKIINSILILLMIKNY